MLENAAELFSRSSSLDEGKLMSINIKVGNKIVIGTGTVLSFNDETVQFILSRTQQPILFSISFESNNTDETGWKKEVIRDEEVKYKMFNFNSNIGLGFTNPEKIGTIEDKILYFAIIISKINTIRTIQYTFYLGDK